MATGLATYLASTEWEAVDLRTVMPDVQYDLPAIIFSNPKLSKQKSLD